MKKNGLIIGLFVVIMGFISACHSDKKPKTLSEVQAYEKPLENVNRYLLKQDEEDIQNYCKHHGWKMKMTKSGLWYGNLKPSSLDSVQLGDMIEIKYQVKLLNGKLLYDSDSLGTKVFEVGHGGVENGLEEGILLMRNKEKFRFIMPPHKAHGLLGDLNKIPARSTIIYYVEIIKQSHKE